MARDHPNQSRQRIQYVESSPARHAREPVGTRRQYLFREWTERCVRTNQLLGGQGRRAWIHESIGIGSGEQGNYRQYGVARLCADQDGNESAPGNTGIENTSA